MILRLIIMSSGKNHLTWAAFFLISQIARQTFGIKGLQTPTHHIALEAILRISDLEVEKMR